MFYLWEMLKFKQFIALTHSRMAISRICKKEQQKTIIYTVNCLWQKNELQK